MNHNHLISFCLERLLSKPMTFPLIILIFCLIKTHERVQNVNRDNMSQQYLRLPPLSQNESQPHMIDCVLERLLIKPKKIPPFTDFVFGQNLGRVKIQTIYFNESLHVPRMNHNYKIDCGLERLSIKPKKIPSIH